MGAVPNSQVYFIIEMNICQQLISVCKLRFIAVCAKRNFIWWSASFVPASHMKIEVCLRAPSTTNKKSTARVPFLLAGMAGFGPTNVGVKVLCLTAWRHPNNIAIITHKTRYVNEKSLKSARISKKPFLMLKLNQKKPWQKIKTVLYSLGVVTGGAYLSGRNSMLGVWLSLVERLVRERETYLDIFWNDKAEIPWFPSTFRLPYKF